MKTLMAAVALVVGLAVFAALPAAALDNPDGKAASLVERLQDLSVTDEQEARIADIRKEYRAKVVEAAKVRASLGMEEMEKIRAVLTAEQKEKLAALKEDRKEHREECLAHRFAHLKELDLTDAEMARIGELREEFRPRMRKALEGLHGLLTDEQKKARKEGLQADKKRRDILASLKFSNEQKEKVEAVGKEMGTLVRQELEKIQDLLTEGQEEKIAEFREERRDRVRDRQAHRIANLKDLNLTEDQVMKIVEIRKEYRPKIHEAGNKLRGTVREEVQAIVAVLKV